MNNPLEAFATPCVINFGKEPTAAVLARFRKAIPGHGGDRRCYFALMAADTTPFREKVAEAMGCALVWQGPPSGLVARPYEPGCDSDQVLLPGSAA